MNSRLLSTSLEILLLVGLTAEAGARNETEPRPDEPAPKSTDSVATADTAKPKDSTKTKAKESIHPKATTKSGYEKATFGAGCFWHVEADFERLPGVLSAVSGYSGGDPRFRSYDMVHEGWTGHAEVVQVTYDPEVITYEDLLKVFWSCHDPTTLNRQGPDEGPQYRSVIFYHSKEQRDAALKSYRRLTAAGVFSSPIVTELQPMKGFYVAEPEHQDYYGGKPRSTTRRVRTPSKKAAKSQTKGKSSTPTAKPADRSSTETPAETAN